MRVQPRVSILPLAAQSITLDSSISRSAPEAVWRVWLVDHSDVAPRGRVTLTLHHDDL